jgi:cytidylate kinase
MIVAISGLKGAGMSSLAKKICEEYNRRLAEKYDAKIFEEYQLSVCHVGDIWKKLMRDRGIMVDEKIRGFSFSNTPDDNKPIDAKLLEKIRKGKIIADGRNSAILCQIYGIPAYKIYLEASSKVRVGRFIRDVANAGSAYVRDPFDAWTYLNAQFGDEHSLCSVLYHHDLRPADFTADRVAIYKIAGKPLPQPLEVELYDQRINTNELDVQATFDRARPGINDYIKKLSQQGYPIDIVI